MESQELAFVVSEETVGIVTATDAIETTTGEMEDPLDDAQWHGVGSASREPLPGL